jgi:uncharacterized membrane protein YdjX (TVP38/TMEM64 family)
MRPSVMKPAPNPALWRPVTVAHKAVRPPRLGDRLVYIAKMAVGSPPSDMQRGPIRRLLPWLAIGLLAAMAVVAFWKNGLSFEALVANREAIGAFVTEHRPLALLCYIGLYIASVALSVPGSVFLTLSGGFLFGVAVGASAAVIGATVGATLIFLLARSALGEPLLRRAGPRARQLAQGFREDAFSYLLFLRLVPAFPFFLVNLVPAFAGVRLAPFVAATALGVIPGAFAFAFAGTGLDSIITAQKNFLQDCHAAGHADCRMYFDARDVLTPQLLGALVALGLLALVPVAVRRLRARGRTLSIF